MRNFTHYVLICHNKKNNEDIASTEENLSRASDLFLSTLEGYSKTYFNLLSAREGHVAFTRKSREGASSSKLIGGGHNKTENRLQTRFPVLFQMRSFDSSEPKKIVGFIS